MTRTYLLDTGFLVALADAADPAHVACVEVGKGLRGRLLTVEGVIVEAAYLLRRSRNGRRAVWGLIEAFEPEIIEPSMERYSRAFRLMDQYRDVPMDFVDALLVAVAEERSVPTVLSLDRRGFATYRIRGTRKFTLLPD